MLLVQLSLLRTPTSRSQEEVSTWTDGMAYICFNTACIGIFHAHGQFTKAYKSNPELLSESHQRRNYPLLQSPKIKHPPRYRPSPGESPRNPLVQCTGTDTLLTCLTSSFARVKATPVRDPSLFFASGLAPSPEKTSCKNQLATVDMHNPHICTFYASSFISGHKSGGERRSQDNLGSCGKIRTRAGVSAT